MSKRENRKPRDKSATPAASMLIVEEQTSVREFVSTTLRLEGHDVEEAASGQQALLALSLRRFDLVVTDLSGVDGMEVLQTSKRFAPATEVVVMTSERTIDSGLKMMRAGAYGSLMKPFRSEQLILMARRALERKSLVTKVRMLEETLNGRASFDGIVGTSRALTDVLKIVDQIARLDTAVLVSGERGTGKELIARALHALSPRRENPFVTINCGAIPEHLRDGEIFGQSREMADGARPAGRGLLEDAHGGTVFLDDVAELSPVAQQNILQLLRGDAVRPDGGADRRDLDVRVIAATNRDLEKCVEDSSFNEGLYYRLNVIAIQVPPLRDRTEDIPLLAQYFLRRTAQRHGAGQPVISPRAMSVLIGHRWVGNVRELESVIERALAIDRDGVIGLDDLPLPASERVADKVIDRAKSGSLTLGELEREYILEILTECGGSRKKTAKKLGITTATLWRKLKRFEKGES